MSLTLMVRSAEPVTNQSLVGSTATVRTQPRWPAMTRLSFQGACHFGVGTCAARRRTIALVPNCAAVSVCRLYSTTADDDAPLASDLWTKNELIVSTLNEPRSATNSRVLILLLQLHISFHFLDHLRHKAGLLNASSLLLNPSNSSSYNQSRPLALGFARPLHPFVPGSAAVSLGAATAVTGFLSSLSRDSGRCRYVAFSFVAMRTFLLDTPSPQAVS